MAYTFTNSEKTKQKASEYETYAALYMFGVYPQKNKMQYILVDSFNDVSTSDEEISEIYDIQSKGYSKISQGQIGRFLYTLYKNYQTSFPFKEFLLFLEKIDSKYLIINKSVFGFANFNEVDKKKVKLGLCKEIQEREKLSKLEDSEWQQINSFLQTVTFVINTSNKQDAVKNLIPIKETRSQPDTFYISIFDEIRNTQSSLKNINIENKIIQIPKEVLFFNKHITRKELDGLLVNRIIGVDLFKDDFLNNIPITFFSYLQKKQIDSEDIEDLIFNCNEELSLMYFDKNNKKNVWKLIFLLIDLVNKNNDKKCDDIFSLVSEKTMRGTRLSKDTVVYLISRIQEGSKYANS